MVRGRSKARNGGRERNAALDLDLYFGLPTGRVPRVNDDVVERLAFAGSLEFDAFDNGAGQPPGFGADEHRK
jgi:hypothetical protein